MNSQFVADWSSNMGDASAPLGGEDDGLIGLLWCNGHVVMQSQAPPRKPPSRPEKASAPAMQEDEAAAAWFQYPVVDDGESLEKDLFSEIFGEMAPAHAGRTCMEEERGAAVTALQSGVMPPSPRPEKAGWENEVGDNYARGASEGVVAAMDAGESSSVLTIGSRRVCGSNHVQVPCVVVSDTTAGDSAPPPPIRDGTSSVPARSSHHDPSTTVTTSSSMRSRPPGAASRKRKQSGSMDQPESLSEDVEYESAAATREPAQKLTTAKRRRAAEVHNLSERRRRDRINEKMKSLQELIPHCNKTDKVSMLDEAIEYLKSLQRQVQMMWMDGDMAAAAATPAPVMFPAGVHQYMPRMASMPWIPPFMPAAQSFPAVSHLPAAGSYPRCLAVEHLQPPPSAMHYMQGMMRFYQLGAAKNPQQNTAPPPPPVVLGGSLPATAVAPPPDNALHRNYGVKL